MFINMNCRIVLQLMEQIRICVSKFKHKVVSKNAKLLVPCPIVLREREREEPCRRRKLQRNPLRIQICVENDIKMGKLRINDKGKVPILKSSYLLSFFAFLDFWFCILIFTHFILFLFSTFLFSQF